MLEYDPYLDSSIIPPSKGDEKKAKDMTEQERKDEEERKKKVEETLKSLAASPKGRIIFSRQEYSIKDGRDVGLQGDFYLYLNAPDDFLSGAEQRFKDEFKTIKRATPEEEKKVVDAIKEEHDKASLGFGSIFG